jgi:peroxiredoxin Q/BCP
MPKAAPLKKSVKASTPKEKVSVKASTGKEKVSKLPAFSLKNQNDSIVKELEGKVVIFMYPKANTPGCTKQACGFRDSYTQITDKGYQIYGLSADSPKSLLNWKEKYDIPFDFLSDPDYVLIKFFGAFKTPKGIKRSVIVLEDGLVVLKEIQISPLDSVSKVLEFIGV